jgi:hypothetical protein
LQNLRDGGLKRIARVTDAGKGGALSWQLNGDATQTAAGSGYERYATVETLAMIAHRHRSPGREGDSERRTRHNAQLKPDPLLLALERHATGSLDDVVYASSYARQTMARSGQRCQALGSAERWLLRGASA